MLFTALLAGVFLFCLFYQSLPLSLVLALSVMGGGLLYRLGQHSHQSLSTIDFIAQRSGLQVVHCRTKCFTCLALLCLCVSSSHRYTGCFVFCVALVLIVWVGKLPLHDYISLLCLPFSFLMLSCLALLFSFTNAPGDVLSISIFGGYLSITQAAQQQALTLCIKAGGALSCLYLLSLSTTMSQLIALCKVCKLPALLSELMYLIYRYIFILYAVSQQMHHSARSRLGFSSYPRQIKSVGLIYSNLLAQSFRKASQSFDAMESRCYTGEINFLTQDAPPRRSHLTIAGAVVLAALAITIGGLG